MQIWCFSPQTHLLKCHRADAEHRAPFHGQKSELKTCCEVFRVADVKGPAVCVHTASNIPFADKIFFIFCIKTLQLSVSVGDFTNCERLKEENQRLREYFILNTV